MNGRVLLLLAALIGVILGGLWYHNTYMCCCDNATSTTGSKANSHLPYYFNSVNDNSIDMGEGFAKYADSLQRNYGAGDTLKITGYYYNGEDSTVGLARANALKTSLANKFATAIFVAKAEKINSTTPNGEFAGANANIVKAIAAPVAKDVTTSVVTDGKLILYFPTGSTAEKFDAATETNIKNVIEASKQAGKTILVTGHTDNKGDAAKNLTLSQGRAEKVKAILTSRGANASIIKTEGFGQTKPIDPADTDAARAKNRRVEVSVN